MADGWILHIASPDAFFMQQRGLIEGSIINMEHAICGLKPFACRRRNQIHI